MRKKKRIDPSSAVQLLSNKRKRFDCTVCGKSVFNLNRHLQAVHDISGSCRQHFPELVMQRKKDQKRKVKCCPLSQKFVSRLDHHLLHTTQHGSISRTRYNQLVQQAERMDHNSPADGFAKCADGEDVDDIETECGPSLHSQENAPSSCTVDSKMLSAFECYLQTFDGGSAKPAQAKRHVFNIYHILSFLTSNVDSCQEELSKVVDEKVKSGTWRPNTAKIYLGSLALLSKFILKMKDNGKDQYRMFSASGLKTLNESITNWNHSLKKKADACQRNEMRKNTDRDLVNPDDFQKYFQSERSKEAEELLDEAKSMKITMDIHTKVRNHLLLQTAISNAHRTGCLTNLTVSEFKQGKNHIRNGSYIVFVKDHKTSTTHGDSELVMSKELYMKIRTYIKVIRPASTVQKVFVVWSGKEMSAGSVADALTTELCHAGIDKKLNCTKIRHLATSLVSALLKEDDQKDLADLMLHSSATQQKYYNECLKGNRKVRMSKILSKLMSGTEVTKEDLAAAEYELPGYDLSKSKVPGRKVVPITKTKTVESADESDESADESGTCLPSNVFDVEKVEPSVMRQKLPLVEENFVLKNFAGLIVGSCTLTKLDELIKNNPLAKTYLEKKYPSDPHASRKICDLCRKYSKRPDKYNTAQKFMNKQ